MALLSITTPRGSLVQVESGNGTVTAELHWDASFGRRRTQDFNRVQSFIDSEVIRLMSPYTPIQTSMLIKSATLDTVIGSGKIKQIAPYRERVQHQNRGFGRELEECGCRCWRRRRR